MSDLIPKFIRDLMPEADEATLHGALENVRSYLRAVEDLYERTVEKLGNDSTKSETESQSEDGTK